MKIFKPQIRILLIYRRTSRFNIDGLERETLAMMFSQLSQYRIYLVIKLIQRQLNS